MAKNHQTLEEIVNSCFKNLKNHNITLGEFCDTHSIEKPLLEIILNTDNEIINTLSRFIKNSGHRLSSRVYNISTHTHDNIGKYYIIKRLIEPKCSINYDPLEAKFFRFRSKDKYKKISMNDKQNILHDFEQYLINKIL